MAGYFKTPVTAAEQDFVDAIAKYVTDKEQETPNKVRLAKITVHIILELKLPIKLMSYEMGYITRASPNFDRQEKFTEFIPLLAKEFNSAPEQIIEKIEEGMNKYSQDMGVTIIRRTQYEYLKDTLYLSRLNLEEFIDCSSLIDEREQFLDLLTELLINIPKEQPYEDIYITFKEFAIAANALLTYADDSQETERLVESSIGKILKYLDGLNAQYRQISGYETLFSDPVRVKDLSYRGDEARHSVFELKNHIERSDTMNQPELELSDQEIEVYKEASELLRE